jgi:hypothetical protein
MLNKAPTILMAIAALGVSSAAIVRSGGGGGMSVGHSGDMGNFDHHFLALIDVCYRGKTGGRSNVSACCILP